MAWILRRCPDCGRWIDEVQEKCEICESKDNCINIQKGE